MTDPFTIDSPNFNHNGGTFCQKIDMRTVGGAFFECVKDNFSVRLLNLVSHVNSKFDVFSFISTIQNWGKKRLQTRAILWFAN